MAEKDNLKVVKTIATIGVSIFGGIFNVFGNIANHPKMSESDRSKDLWADRQSVTDKLRKKD